MSRALAKLQKLRGRSATELRVRAAQAVHAQAERWGLAAQARPMSDAACFRLLDPAHVGRGPHTAATLHAQFRARQTPHVSAAFADADATRAELRRRFGAAAPDLSARAARIGAGRFDLLGRPALDFGVPVDWQLEPVSGRRTPLVHWSQIDFLAAAVAGDKKFTWELNRQQFGLTLGRAYWHTGAEAWAATFAAHVAGWLDANPPTRGINWASSLEVALRAIAWLWALQFFQTAPALTPALYLRLLKSLYTHARHLETYLSTYFAPNTHLTGEALGLYYLGTLVPEFKRAARWRATGRRILLAQLDRHIKPDGVYFEQSTYYQRYTADFYLHFLLLARAHDDLPAAAAHKLTTKLTALLDHLMYLTRPDGTTPYVGDDDGGQLAPLDERPPADFRATLATAAVLLARPDYKFVAGAATEATLWLTGAAGLRAYDELPAHAPAATSRAFPDGGYYVMRDGWTHDANYLLFVAGPHGAPALNYGHAHADALAFDLAARGRTLLVDPGTYTYTGSAQERDHFRGAAAHNTLTIDGAPASVPAGPFRWQHVAHAHAHAWHSHARFDHCAATHDGYARSSGHERYERAVLLLKRDYWLIRDRVRATGTHHYELNFQCAPGVEPHMEAQTDAPALHLTAAGAPVLSLFTCGGSGAWQQAAGWVSPCYGVRVPAPMCRYTTDGAGAQEFITFLLPPPWVAGATVRRTPAPGGAGYELHHAAGRDVVLTCVGRTVTSDRLVSDFDWTWARFGPDGALAELLLIGGRSCRLDGQPVVASAAPVAYAYVQRVGAELVVETDPTQQRRADPDERALGKQE